MGRTQRYLASLQQKDVQEGMSAVHYTVLVLLPAHVERFGVSCMREFLLLDYFPEAFVHVSCMTRAEPLRRVSVLDEGVIS